MGYFLDPVTLGHSYTIEEPFRNPARQQGKAGKERRGSKQNGKAPAPEASQLPNLGGKGRASSLLNRPQIFEPPQRVPKLSFFLSSPLQQFFPLVREPSFSLRFRYSGSVKNFVSSC